MSKEAEMKTLQQKFTMLSTQQQQRTNNIEELQVEVERVTCIIQHVHHKVGEVAESVGNIISKHIISDLVDKLKKIEEEVRQEEERVTKILQYFQRKVSTSEKLEK